MNRSLLVKGQGGHYGAQTWRGAARRAQPPPHRPPSRPPLPPLSPFPQRPSRQTPRRAAIGWRAGPMAGPLLGRVGPGRTWRGGRGARAGTAAAGGRAPSTCPGSVRVSGFCPCVRPCPRVPTPRLPPPARAGTRRCRPRGRGAGCGPQNRAVLPQNRRGRCPLAAGDVLGAGREATAM